MTIVLGDRRSGKTTELIKLSHKHDLIIVTFSRNMLREYKVMAKRMELTIPDPITVNDLQSADKMSGFDKDVIIDELDLCFDELLKYSKYINIKGFSVDTTDDTIVLPDIKERLGEELYKKEKSMLDRTIEMHRRIK